MTTDCTSQDIHPQNCRRPYSFFREFIQQYWRQDGGENPLHRVCSLMRKMKVETFFSEKLMCNGKIKEEIEAIGKRCRGKIKEAEIWRISFFNKSITTVDEIKDGYDENFLGYVVILNVKLPNGEYRSYIPQSVIRTPTIYKEKFSPLNTMNQYIHTAKDFLASVGEKKLKIYGSFYCQQNGLTNVCAHAALRMVLNNLRGQEQNIDNETINKKLGIDHVNKILEYGNYSEDKHLDPTNYDLKEGLDLSDVETVLTEYGLKIITQDFFSHLIMDYHDFLYAVIESGFPAMFAFTTKREEQQTVPTLHVVPIIGHTLNTDIWHPEAKFYYRYFKDANYHPSSSWVDHFIFHDDNFGMYYNFATKSMDRLTVPRLDPEFRAYYGIGVFPRKVKSSPVTIQRFASKILHVSIDFFSKRPDVDDGWIKELKRQQDRNRYPVIRTMLIERRHYLNHLKRLRIQPLDSNSETIEYTQPEFDFIQKSLRGHRWLWMNEISLYDLYSANKTKIGELIFRCDKDYDEPIDLLLLGRLSSYIIKPIPRGGLEFYPTDIKTHHELFTFKRTERNLSLDW